MSNAFLKGEVGVVLDSSTHGHEVTLVLSPVACQRLNCTVVPHNRDLEPEDVLARHHVLKQVRLYLLVHCSFVSEHLELLKDPGFLLESFANAGLHLFLVGVEDGRVSVRCLLDLRVRH